eukprot:g18271.t1
MTFLHLRRQGEGGDAGQGERVAGEGGDFAGWRQEDFARLVRGFREEKACLLFVRVPCRRAAPDGRHLWCGGGAEPTVPPTNAAAISRFAPVCEGGRLRHRQLLHAQRQRRHGPMADAAVNAVTVLQVFAEIRNAAEQIQAYHEQARRLSERVIAIEPTGKKRLSSMALSQLLETLKKIKKLLDEHKRVWYRRSNTANFGDFKKLFAWVQGLQLDNAVNGWDDQDAADRLEDIETLKDDVKRERRYSTDNRAEYTRAVKLYAASTIAPNLCMVMEYAREGSLWQFLHSSRKPLTHAMQTAFLFDIARGMAYLHMKGILHRDLKSANMLLFSNRRLKLRDFVLSKIKAESSSGSSRGAVGTGPWMSPEEMNSTTGSAAPELTDVYSFGVVCFEVATRMEPFKGMVTFQVMNAAAYSGVRPQVPEWASPAPTIVPLMERCWKEDPAQRPEGFTPVVWELASVVKLAGDPRHRSSADFQSSTFDPSEYETSPKAGANVKVVIPSLFYEDKDGIRDAKGHRHTERNRR